MRIFSLFYYSFICIFLYSKLHAKPLEEITIAAFYNFSGPQSTLDIFSANGAKLAIESINKAGGLLGKRVNLIFMDGKSDPKLLARNAQNVAKNPDIFLTLGLTNTDMAKVVIPPLNKANKLFISAGATSPHLPSLSPNFVFLSCFSDETQGKAAAQFAFNRLHIRKPLVIEQSQYDYAQIISNFYVKEWLKLSKDKKSINQILISKNFTEKDALLKIIKNFTPDAVFIAAEPDIVLQTTKFLRESEYIRPIIGGDTFDSDDIKSIKNGNIFYTTHSFVSKENPDPIVQVFIKQYEDKFKQEPDSSFAALGFDSVYLLAHAVTLAHSTNPVKVANAIRKIKKYHLITGTVNFNENSNIPKKTLTIIHVQSGKKNIAEIID